MAKNTSVLLGDYFENFIGDKISSGRFSTASEVIRATFRLLELEEQKVKKLIAEIEISEKSGIVENFDAKKHLEFLNSRKRNV